MNALLSKLCRGACAKRLILQAAGTAGAEVMKPLATPVIGGMVSSLLHVLIVTPVIFYWLKRRALEF